MDQLSLQDVTVGSLNMQDWLPAFPAIATLINCDEDKMTKSITTFGENNQNGYTTILGTQGQAVVSLSKGTIYLIWVKQGSTECWVTRTSVAHNVRLPDHSIFWKPRRKKIHLNNSNAEFTAVCGCSAADLEKDFPAGPIIARFEEVCRPPRAQDLKVVAHLTEEKIALEKQLQATEDQIKSSLIRTEL